MKQYRVTLRSISPYGQSRYHGEPKRDKETSDAHERRTWRSRMHVDENGIVFIPPTAVKNCLSEAAKYLGIQIPGKGKSTYTKHFEAGVMCTEPISLGITHENVEGLELFVPSSGKRGDGKRVMKIFPKIARWEGSTTITVLDETVTAEVLLKHLVSAGQLIGMGFFRPRNNGFFGRFEVTAFEEINADELAAAE